MFARALLFKGCFHNFHSQKWSIEPTEKERLLGKILKYKVSCKVSENRICSDSFSGAVVITIGQLHSAKPALRFCAGSNPARGVSKIRNGEDLLTMVPAGNKVKRLSSVNHITKTVIIIIIIIIIITCLKDYFFGIWVNLRIELWSIHVFLTFTQISFRITCIISCIPLHFVFITCTILSHYYYAHHIYYFMSLLCLLL